MTPDISCRSLIQIGLQIPRWLTKWRPCKGMAVSQAFMFHVNWYSLLHFAVCQLLCWAFLLCLSLYTECSVYQYMVCNVDDYVNCNVSQYTWYMDCKHCCANVYQEMKWNVDHLMDCNVFQYMDCNVYQNMDCNVSQYLDWNV